jgi:hypothetical protein
MGMTCAGRTERFGGQHRAWIIWLTSFGAAKITEALSPIIPVGTIAGAPFAGPSWLEWS